MVHIHFLGDKSGCVFGKGKIYVFGKLGKIYREECTHLAAGKEMYWLQRLPMAMVYRKEFCWKNMRSWQEEKKWWFATSDFHNDSQERISYALLGWLLQRLAFTLLWKNIRT